MSENNEKVTASGPPLVGHGHRGLTRADFGAELKRRRVEQHLTQEAAARGLGVQRATLTQWESGRHLPSPEKTTEVDHYFGAAGALVALVEAARAGGGAGPARRILPLSAVFSGVGRALLRHVAYDDNGRPLGWSRNLSRRTNPTPLSTAYGIRTLQMLDQVPVDLGSLARAVLDARTGAAWASRSSPVPRPEATAVVLDALCTLGLNAEVEDEWRWLEDAIHGVARLRPYIIATVLEAAARHRTESSFVPRLVDDLLATRKDFGSAWVWPATAAPDVVRIQPSLVHTARAVTALRLARPALDRADIDDAIDQAVEWIVGRSSHEDERWTEIIRPDPDRHDLDVPVSHFTSAWVIRALAGLDGVPAPRMHAALAWLWDSYSAPDGLWAWKTDGQLPVWLTHDATAALWSLALASFATPLPAPPENDNVPSLGDAP